MRRII